MKKRFLNVAGLLAIGTAVMFTSCSNDEDIVNPEMQDNTQVLTLSVESSGDGLTTRAGRPLYSNAPNQKIDYVALYFVDDKNKVVLTKKVDWSNSVVYTTGGHGKQLEVALKGEQKLADGEYTIYAVGYSNNSDYTFSPSLPNDDNSSYNANSSTSWNSFTASINESDAEEVFAGSTKVTVSGKAFNLNLATGRKNAITLHRQVAGMTGYFTNIPVSVDGKATRYIRLVSVDKNTKVRFGQFNSSFKETDKNVNYIVNGETSASPDAKYADSPALGAADAHTIYKIDLADWFVSQNSNDMYDFASCDLDKDGFLGYKDVKEYVKQESTSDATANYENIWKNPHYSEGIRFVRGSVFNGKFVIPFEKGEKNTLQLQLLDADGYIIKYWNINANDVHTGSTTEEESWEKFDQNVSIYNIYRNHMYNVGMKAADKPGKPTDPDPTDPTDPEDPEDLSKGQDLIIQVNDNWEVIHEMEID